MVSTTLSLIAFFTLIAWRFVFTGLQRGPLAREIAAPQQQHTNISEHGLHILELSGAAIIPGNSWESVADGIHRIAPKDRPKTYLRRIVALTGGTQMGNGYDLNVGTTRFPCAQ